MAQVRLEIHQCDFCERVFYTPATLSPPERCCWCGSTTEVVTTATVVVEEANNGYQLELSCRSE